MAIMEADTDNRNFSVQRKICQKLLFNLKLD